MFKRTLSFLSLFLVLSMVLTACGGTEATPHRERPGDGNHRQHRRGYGGGNGTLRTRAPRAAPPPPRPARLLEPPASRPPRRCYSGRNLTQSFVRNFNPFASRPLAPTVAGIYEP